MPKMKQFTPDKNKEELNLLAQWWEIKDEAKELAARERELRTKLASLFTKHTKKAEGTVTVGLPKDCKLKVVLKQNYNLDESALPSVLETLAEDGVASDDLVAYKPSLKKSAYKSMSKEQKDIFSEALILKPGTPTLEIVVPKPAEEDS